MRANSLDGYAVLMNGEAIDADAECEPDIGMRACRLEQRSLQVAAVNDPIRRAEACGGVRQWNAGDLPAVACVQNAHGLRGHRGRAQPVAQSQIDQDAGRVRRQLNAGASLIKPFGLVEDDGAQAAMRETECSGEA